MKTILFSRPIVKARMGFSREIRRWPSLFALCITLVSCYGNLAHAELRILPLGDSITRGEGAAASLVPGGYRDPLAHLLSEDAASFRFVGDNSSNPSDFLTATQQTQHSGHGGWRIDQIHNNITNWQTSFQPDAVLLLIGTNDILQNSNLGNGSNFDTSNAIARLTALLNTLYANNNSLHVVVSTLVPIQDSRDGFVKNYNAFLSSTVVPAFLSQGRSITLVDNYVNFVTGPATWRSERFDDAVHPNAAGYQAMGATWHAAVAELPIPPDDPPPPPPPATLLSSSDILPGMNGFDSQIRPNLVRAGQSSLAGVTVNHGPSLPATFRTAGLNDGSAASNSNLTYYAANDATGNLPTLVTFTFAGSSTGYDITSIESIAGWQDSNIGNQTFQLQVSTDGHRYRDYGSYSASSETGGFSSLIKVSDSTGFVAKNVVSIRLLYLNSDSPQGGNGGSVMREIQVFGSPSEGGPPVPETLESSSEILSGSDSFDSRIRTNLIQNGQPTLGGVQVSQGSSMPATFSTAGLNDGSASANANLTYHALTSGTGNLPAMFTFQLAGSETGYDISSVESIAGWQDSNIGSQKFELQLSIRGRPFSNYGTHTATSQTGNFSSLVNVSDSSGILAKGVTAVRFLYMNPGSAQGGDGGTLIRELQVFGTASAAEEEFSGFGSISFSYVPSETPGGSTAAFSFQATIPGAYTFQRSFDLEEWEDREMRAIGQDELGLINFTDSEPSGDKAFYRVIWQR